MEKAPDSVNNTVRDGFYKLHQEILKDAGVARETVQRARALRQELRAKMNKLKEIAEWLYEHSNVKSDNIEQSVERADAYIRRELDGQDDE